ncbi:hypothetical protein ACOME3_006763 [Neoechinorhynchus agilis]
MRRNRETLGTKAGNRIAVLVGDYILATSCGILGRLKDGDVIELMSRVIEDLVTGEFVQMENMGTEKLNELTVGEWIHKYFQRIYLKTGSLFANSCKSCAILAESPIPMIDALYGFGRNVGIAFQLADDILDYEGKSAVFGKNVGADLKQKVWTAPTLIALSQNPELKSLFESNDEDAFDRVRNVLLETNSISKTKYLCKIYIEQAVECLRFAFGDIESSDETKFLYNVCDFVINRHL